MKTYLIEFEIVTLQAGLNTNTSILISGETLTDCINRAYDEVHNSLPDFIDGNSINYCPIIKKITFIDGAEVL